MKKLILNSFLALVLFGSFFVSMASFAQTAPYHFTLEEVVRNIPVEQQSQLRKELSVLPETEYKNVDVAVSLGDPSSRVTPAQVRLTTRNTDAGAVSTRSLVFLGARIGFYMPWALEALHVLEVNHHALLVSDVSFARSKIRQEFSIGTAISPFQIRPIQVNFLRGFFIGAHGKLIDLTLPGTRGYDQKFDQAFGSSVDAGFRGFVGKKHNLVAGFKLSSTSTYSKYRDLPNLYSIDLSIAVRIVPWAGPKHLPWSKVHSGSPTQ